MCAMYHSESESEVAQLCLTLCDPMDCSLPGSSIHGIFQGRVLEWVTVSFSRGSSWPRDRTRVSVSCIAGGFLPIWATREVPPYPWGKPKTGRMCALWCSQVTSGFVERLLHSKIWSGLSGSQVPTCRRWADLVSLPHISQESRAFLCTKQRSKSLMASFFFISTHSLH